MAAMLKQIDALPGAKRGATVDYWNGKLRLRKRCADVRGHVVGPFHRVAVAGVVLRGDPLKKIAKVGDDIGIGIFLNGEGCRCMLAEQGQQSGGEVALRNPVDDGRCEIVKALAGRGDLKPGGELFHDYA